MSWSVEDVESHWITVALTKRSFMAFEKAYTAEEKCQSLTDLLYTKNRLGAAE